MELSKIFLLGLLIIIALAISASDGATKCYKCDTRNGHNCTSPKEENCTIEFFPIDEEEHKVRLSNNVDPISEGSEGGRKKRFTEFQCYKKRYNISNRAKNQTMGQYIQKGCRVSGPGEKCHDLEGKTRGLEEEEGIDCVCSTDLCNGSSPLKSSLIFAFACLLLVLGLKS